MVKRLLFIATLFSTSFALNAQGVAETQQALIAKTTATWCSICGGWGWTSYQDLINNYDENAVLIAAHRSTSSSLHSPTAAAIINNIGGVSGQPVFTIDNTVLGSGASNVAADAGDYMAGIENVMPVAQTGLLVEADGNSITVNTKTRFFQDGSGDYYLALYVIEKSVIANQASQGSSADHKSVLRDAFSDNEFGEQIALGEIPAGSEFTGTYTFELSSAMENFEIAAVIWNNDGDNYEFVNAYSSKDPVIPAEPDGVNDITLQDAKMQINPTIARASSIVIVDVDIAMTDAEITVYDFAGQPIQTLFSGNLNAGQQSFELSNLPKGSYLVSLQADGKVLTKQMIFN